MAGQSTISRFENSIQTRVLFEMRDVLFSQFIALFQTRPAQITIDLDAFDDPTHGNQQMTSFHGFYDQYQYLPIIARRLHAAWREREPEQGIEMRFARWPAEWPQVHCKLFSFVFAYVCVESAGSIAMAGVIESGSGDVGAGEWTAGGRYEPEVSAKVFQSTSSGRRDGRGPTIYLTNAADQSSGYGECELPPGRGKDIGLVALSGAFQDGQQPDPEYPTTKLNLWSGGVHSTSQNDTGKVTLG
jgi:hypothetical protein